MPFATVDVSTMVDPETMILGFEKSQILDTAEMVMLVVMGILVVLLVMRPLISSLIEAQKVQLQNARDEAAMLMAQATPAALAAPQMSYDDDGNMVPNSDGQVSPTSQDNTMLDMNAVDGRVKASSVKKVGDIVNTHPSETVSVIRNWMAQE